MKCDVIDCNNKAKIELGDELGTYHVCMKHKLMSYTVFALMMLIFGGLLFFYFLSGAVKLN